MSIILTKKQLYFVVSWRGLTSIAMNLNAEELRDALGPIKNREINLLREWEVTASQYDVPEYYEEKTFSTVKTILSSKHGDLFRIPSSLKPTIADILVFFEMKGCDITPVEYRFTPSQQAVLDAEEGIVCVNSGPGTGKTFIASEKAAKLMREGVLVISFSNETITQNFERLSNHVSDIKKVGKKQTRKQKGNLIDVTTIDALANDILGKTQSRSEKSALSHDYFEGVIATCISDIISKPHLPIFWNNFNEKRYAHMIVDEAQDLSDGHGTIIKIIYEKFGFKSLTLFGDPRQRINFGVGQWYEDMCKNDTVTILDAERPVQNFKFEYSFRFKTEKLFDICNTISQSRPAIHVDMIPRDEIVRGNRIMILTNVAQIIETISSRSSPGDIAIIAPSIEKKNQCTKILDEIKDYLIANNIAINYSYVKGAMQQGVLFSSIHAAKGKEFKDTILVGFSNYPYSYSSVYGSMNDGESLNFVAHTRSTHRIFYYMPDVNFQIPAHVTETLVKVTNFERHIPSIKLIREPVFSSIDPCVIPVEHVAKFASTNQMLVKTSIIGSFPRFPVEKIILHYILTGIGGGKTPQVKKIISGDHDTCGHSEFHQQTKEGAWFEGLDLETGRLQLVQKLPFTPCPSNVRGEEFIESLMTDPNNLKAYVEMVTAKQNLFDVNQYLPIVTSLIPETPESFTCKNVIYHMRQITVSFLVWTHQHKTKTCNTMIIVCQSAEVGYGVFCSYGKCDRLIVITNDTIMRVTSALPRPQFRYWLDKLAEIYIHVSLVKHRENQNPDRVSTYRKCYFVDSEFNPEGKKLVEIAMVNSKDPYRSICKPLSCDVRFAKEYFAGIRPVDEFETGYSMDELIMLLAMNALLPVCYFHCATDVDWIDEDFEMEKINVSKTLRAMVHDKMTVSHNRIINQGDCYQLIMNRTIESQTHLLQHTALSDALVLWEILH